MDNSIIKAFLDNPVNGRLVLSASFANFIKFFHWYMYHQEFIFRDFHIRIIKKLEDIAFGRASKKNLIINIPPRFGKSSIMKYFCAWSYMLNPHSNNIYTSYSDDLANAFSKDIRGIVESDAFKALTGVTLKKSKTGADYWETSEGGGFRAAPMGGAITGFGAGVSDGTFGGTCLPYNTMVWTERGLRRIGELVRRKSKIKVWSWNGRELELQPIDGWIKNPRSEYIRVGLSDGRYIDCTPDHKIYTKRGLIRADELLKDDILFSMSNFFDLSECNINKSHNFFSRYRCIKNNIHFFFSKVSGFFRVINNFLCPSFKRFTLFNVNNRCFANIKRFGNDIYRSRVFTYCHNVFFRKRASRKYKSSDFNGILHIIGFCSVGKVFKPVIRWVRVKMSNLHTLFLFTNKSPHNRLVNVQRLIPAIYISSYFEIAFSVITKFKDSSFAILKRIVTFVKSFVGVSSQSSEIRNTISGEVRYLSPLFIKRIGHKKHSYCLTIRHNHNMLIGKSQGLLVSNCLIDDPNKASSVKSQAELQNVIDYYLNTLKSRLNDQARTPIVLIMQRLSLDDLTGYLLENEADDWDWIKLQALDEDTGVALWEDKFPAKELIKLKNQSPFVYYGQYQQEPIVLGGSVIKTEWFKFYNTSEKYGYQLTWFTSDTAMKKGEGNDFSVLCFWGKTYDNRLHLIDMVRGKYDAEELRQQVILFWEKWKGFETIPYGYYIEDKASGIGIIQEIKKNYPIPVIPIARARHKDDKGMWVSMDKFSRCMTALPYIANGWVYLPNSENDVISSVVLAETAAFKADLSHKHDDICDNFFDAIDIAFGSTGISSIFI